MKKKRFTEQELLKGLDASSAHTDELAQLLQKELTLSESEAAFDSLCDRALQEILDYFHGDRDAMERWLSSEVRGLGYITPEEALRTRAGIERLRTLIGRLEHGIPT